MNSEKIIQETAKEMREKWVRSNVIDFRDAKAFKDAFEKLTTEPKR